MKRLISQLWKDDDGFVLTTETVLYGTVGVLGIGAGAAAMRDSVNSELNDVAKAIGSIDQSFWFSPVVGHSAWTAGSCFYDTADYCDQQQQPYVAPAARGDRPQVCADVFGREGDVRIETSNRPQPTRAEAVIGGPSKGVVIAEPGPAYVVGSPALVPCPQQACEGAPVNVMVDPHTAGPYMVTVPEGYFNTPPGTVVPAPHYRVMVHGHGAPRDLGYAYAPAHRHGRKAASWDTIDLGFAKVGDDELKSIEKFEDAKCLHVLGSNVTNKGLSYICEMDDLESLHLVGTQITDEGLKQLKELKKLRFLHLVGMKITDDGLAALASLKSLEELDVRGTPVSDEALAKLQQELPKLRVIR